MGCLSSPVRPINRMRWPGQQLNKNTMQELVSFLDYLSRESRGRTVILVSLGSAFAIGSPQVNEKLLPTPGS
jgi:hypothetical protein